jgi:O-acetylhomoserine/O-acetylserine sulfhydrylase-like pyridoxal-dependent enzyme
VWLKYLSTNGGIIVHHVDTTQPEKVQEVLSSKTTMVGDIIVLSTETMQAGLASWAAVAIFPISTILIRGGTNRLLKYLSTNGGIIVHHVDTTQPEKVQEVLSSKTGRRSLVITSKAAIPEDTTRARCADMILAK